VPRHVVYRPFPTETVLLNLETGSYHGLDPTGGRMLELLEAGRSLPEAAATMAEEYDQSAADVESDLRELCRSLLQRGLIQADCEHDI
jgi:Coenzyme PQQ synthesis protein D (PqqD)